MRNLSKEFFLLLIATAFLAACSGPAADVIDLSGEWQVSLDSPDAAPQAIRLPGTTDLAGLGTPDTLPVRLAKPQVLRLTRRHCFVGEAFYTRSFEVTKQMSHRPLELTLERVLWRSTVLIDGQPVEALDHTDESLVTPHRYTLHQGLAEGRHTIRVTVDNRRQYDVSVDELCHSYTDATQVKWNGILGRMELRALPTVSIDRMEVYPDPTLKRLDVVLTLTNHSSELLEAYMVLISSPKGRASDEVDRESCGKCCQQPCGRAAARWQAEYEQRKQADEHILREQEVVAYQGLRQTQQREDYEIPS